MTAMNTFSLPGNKACCQLIYNSNELYQEMLNTLIAIGNTPEAATPQQLQARLLHFNELQQQIEVGDQLLHETLGEISDPDEELRHLLDARRDLIEQLIQHNRKVTMQSLSIKSVIADEIRKCSAGHIAMKGYRSSDQQQTKGSFRKAM